MSSLRSRGGDLGGAPRSRSLDIHHCGGYGTSENVSEPMALKSISYVHLLLFSPRILSGFSEDLVDEVFKAHGLVEVDPCCIGTQSSLSYAV